MVRSWTFAKGHGTRNDFVVVTDRHGMMQPTVEDIAHACDRRVGVGADGFLRAIKASHMSGWEGDGDLWFMDARLADGSPDVVGGNGLRVFVRYLFDQGLVEGDRVRVATRLGVREAQVLPDGRIATSTGPVVDRDPALVVRAGRETGEGEGIVVDVAHAICRTEVPLATLDFGDVEVTLSDGSPAAYDNVCFWTEVGPDRVALRHWQRGIGQSVSCGTGAVATARAYLRSTGREEGTVVVDVPGGWLEIALGAHGEGTLRGPARMTIRGELALPDR